MIHVPNPIVDFHMHPGPPSLPVELQLHQCGNMEEHVDNLLQDMHKAGIDRSVMMLLDENWFRTDAGPQLMERYRSCGWAKKLTLCAMFDACRPYTIDDALRTVGQAAALDVRGIKIHPDLQRLTDLDLPNLSALAKQADKLDMFIVVHAYSSTPGKVRNMGLTIAAHIAPAVNVPVVIAHSGGMDFSRAVFLAREHDNIHLDLSYLYSLNQKLPLKQLLKWGLEVLGPERFLYGSDHPSCEADLQKNGLSCCLRELDLNELHTGMIMGQNACRIMETRQ